MSRSIPPALQAYMAGHGLTMGKIVKIGPMPDGSFRALAMVDRAVVYDDGEGELTYIARTGAQMSAFVSSADLGVDNAEMDSLPPVDAFPLEGITDAQIQAGDLDKVPFVVYCLNYDDTSLGHFIWSGGTIGEVRIKGTALINIEQRSLSNQMKQTIVDVDSTTCRARFGSVHIGEATSAGEVEERFPCEYDLSSEWIEGTVTAVDGDDPDLIFADSSLLQADDYFAPGLVEWETGVNAGIETEVGAFAAGEVTLSYATPQPIAIGDTFRIRRECTKAWTGHNSCDTFWGVDKPLHFRGEPHIPIGDGASLNSPGAGTPGAIGGTGEIAEA